MSEDSRIVTLTCSNIVTAFDEKCIGTRVLKEHAQDFMMALALQVKTHSQDVYNGFSRDRVPGQMYLPMPNEMLPMVSSGVGRRTQVETDYVARFYRGKVNLYLSRDHAPDKTEHLACVVYTRDAYLRDPDVFIDGYEQDRIRATYATHVIVAILGSIGRLAPYPPGTFIHNLAGGNREALLWDAGEIRARARDIEKYWNEYATVAD